MSHNISGLAASIRKAVDSETFDLAGKSSVTIENAIRDAFSVPFEMSETIRITFVTGAGKLGRQKYDEGAAKAVTSVLRDLGYEDDHGGGAATFKLQHDTGKNLKTVVVHPKVSGHSSTGVEKDMAGVSLSGGGSETESLIPVDSPEHSIAHSSMNVFERMIQSRCPCWSQKKGCVSAIEGIKAMLEKLDTKLLGGTPLSDSEQDLYDSVSMSSLEEKRAHVRDLMHGQVDGGEITAVEKTMLTQQVSDRIRALNKEIDQAEKDGKNKRVENLRAAKTKAMERRDKIEKLSPRSPPPLKNEAAISKLRLELSPLLDLEEASKGRLLTLKESQAVAKKDEIMQEIEDLENASRGWFETDEVFKARVEASRSAWKASLKKKQSKKKPAGKAPSTASTPSWLTPSARVKAPAKASKPKGKPSGGNVFAAMMADSDSD